MSARQSPVERDARRNAFHALQGMRRPGSSADEALTDAADMSARQTALVLLAGDIPAARRWAHAHRLLADSRARLRARKSRALAAENAAQAAAHGITAGDVVRGVRRGGHLSVGAECTIEDVSGDILWATIDGERHVVWAADVERVEPPAPHDGEDLAEPPYGDRILAIGLWSDSEASELAGVANEAAREGRDPGPAVQDRVRAWDEASA